jgi:hypothetical protein
MSLGLCYPTHRRDLHLFIQLMMTAYGSQTNRLTDSPFLTSHRTLPILRLSPSHDGTCRPSDLMLTSETHNHQFTIDRPNPGDGFAIDQLAPYSPSGE